MSDQEKIRDIVLDARKRGNVVIATFDGLMEMPLDAIVEQPVEGLLYDLNRSEEVVLTFIDDPKWVNDFAVAQVIRELKRQLHGLDHSQTPKTPDPNSGMTQRAIDAS